MALRERLIYAIDVISDGAKTGLAGFKSAVKDAEGVTGKFKAGLGSLWASFASSPTSILAAGAAFGVFAKQAIDAASDLEESTNAVKVSFGSAADSVLALGQNSATSFGLSQAAFNQLAVQFSSFATAVGGTAGSAKVIQDLTTRVADFASVMNIDVAEAARIFQSALAGETEPIRKYGKDLSAVAVEQFALANGLIKTKSEMTEAIKVQARYGLLMQETADTAGDFANTQDSLANQTKILKANVTDLSASFGKQLMPIVADAAATINHLIGIYDDLVSRADGGGGGGPLSGLFDGLIKPGEAFKEILDETEKSLGKLDKMLGDSTVTIVDGIDAWSRAADQSDRYAQSLNEAAHEARNSEQSIAANTAQQDRYVESLETAGQAQLDAAAAAAEKAEWDERAAEAADRHQEAVDSVAEAMDRQTEAALLLVGGDIAVREAQRQAAEATQEFNDKLNEGFESLGAYQQALDDATLEHLGAAQAIADTRARQMEANGETVTAAVKQQLLKEELQKLADNMTGPMRDAILGLIADLEAIPSEVNVNVNTWFNTRGDNPGQRNGPRARGGPTYPGFHEVLEDGPELLQQNGKTYLMSAGGGYVVPMAASPQAMAGGASGPIILMIEGRPFRAMLRDHDGGLALQLAAGRRG